MWSHSPSPRLPQPSFRRKPESMPAGPIADYLNRHSGASRNLVQHCEPSLRRSSPQPSFRRKPESSAALREPSLRRSGPQPSFRRKPESRVCGHIRRHSRLPQPSFRRKPESRVCGHIRRHSRLPQPSFRRKPESRPGRIRSRPRPGAPPTVIPAQAGTRPRLPSDY